MIMPLPAVKIAPSILAANFTKLGEEIINLDKAGADHIHLDVMDGNFVNNLTFGASIIKQIRPLTTKIFDVHLMVDHPEDFIEPMVEAGADIITFHYEACIHHDKLITKIKNKGIKVGIALNPSTPEQVLEYIIDKLDLVLVLTVNPGLGGQSFIPSQLKKIKNIKDNFIKSRNIDLQIDGGVDLTNSKQLKELGATILVAGTAVFKNSNYSANIKALKS
ncbi:Ribulose-phosphate 3-epimerase [Candidatus Hepatincolaceae symbiont of Richtersius coronifer]